MYLKKKIYSHFCPIFLREYALFIVRKLRMIYYMYSSTEKSVSDSYRINITSIDAEHDISMREVYGLDKTLRE